MTIALLMKAFVGVCLLVMGAWVIIANWIMLCANLRNRRLGIDRHHSFVPLFGPLLVSGGLYLTVGWSAWLVAPWAADVATLSLVLLVPFLLARRRPD